MAGPIRNLISMMRERRQERREGGGGLFPRLRERLGDRGLGGNRRVRGLMQMRGGVPTESGEVEPETLPSPVDNSGQGASRVKATTTSTGAAPGTISGPAPVTGDENSLPDVPDQAGLQRKIFELQEQMQKLPPLEAKKLEKSIVTLTGMYDRGMAQQKFADDAKSKTFAHNMAQIDEASKMAVKAGSFSALESLVFSSPLTLKEGGVIIKAPNVAEMVRPHVRQQVVETINTKPYGSLTQEERSVLHNNVAYAYPVKLVGEDGKTAISAKAMAAQANNLYGRFLNDYPVATPQLRAFLRALANVTVKNQAAALGVTGLQLPTGE